MTSPQDLGAAAESASHVPVHLTRFVGRGRELEDLAQLLMSSRLLTLTGAGGSGKTRLAEELALRCGSSFERVGWVDLTPIGDPRLVAQLIATTLTGVSVPLLVVRRGLSAAEALPMLGQFLEERPSAAAVG